MTGAAARWSILAMTQEDGDFPEGALGLFWGKQMLTESKETREKTR